MTEIPLHLDGTRYAAPRFSSMWSRVLRRLLFISALAALFVCIAPKLAHAQATITIYQETSLPRVKDGKDVKKRPINLTPEGVSYQDCIDNVSIRFPVQLAGFEGGGYVQVWGGKAGDACTGDVTRTNPNSRTCWQLGPDLPLQLNQNVELPVRTIMSGLKSATAPDDSAAICGTIDLTTVSVNFLYFAPGQTKEPASTKSISVQIDTVGPAAPTGLRTLPGNTRLIMNWDNISGEGGVSVLTGIRVYCDVNHTGAIPDDPACQDLKAERAQVSTISDAGIADAGADADADADSGTVAAILEDGGCLDELDDAGNLTFSCADAGDAGSTDDTNLGTGGTCESSNLVGKFSPTAAFNECFSCGSITGNTGTSISAQTLRGAPLVNNTVYAIAVAATDAFDNVGPLSEIQCEYPELTNDFWEDYKNAGGHAGGGCNTTGEAPLGTIAVLGTSMAVLITTLRRKRRASQKARESAP